MKSRFILFVSGVALAAMQVALAQTGSLRLPAAVAAGNAFSIQTLGSGTAVLYIVGPGQALKRKVQLGEKTSFASGDLRNAGHYVALLVGKSSAESGTFDVVAANQPAALSFLAKPSRLSVDLHDGISGVAYVFDSYQNLILAPAQVVFQLSGAPGGGQIRTALTRNGVAWTRMDSNSKEGSAQFIARTGSATGTRVIQLVPGNPCSLIVTARPSGQRLSVQTEPVRDCGGNAVPDGTIVTFTETYSGGEATVDVPLKRGIAQTEMPAHNGARISVATGVVMGNEIRWEKQR